MPDVQPKEQGENGALQQKMNNNGPPRLSICHQRAVHKRLTMLAHCNKSKICVCVQNNLAYFPFLRCSLVANRKTRWSIGSAPKSNMYGMMTCMCCIIFFDLSLTQQLITWANTSFITSTKELHGERHSDVHTEANITIQMLQLVRR